MTIRLKLTIGSILAVLLANSALLLVNVRYLAEVWRGEVQTRIRLDLNAARAAYKAHGERIETFLQAASLNEAVVESAQRGDRDRLARLMPRLFTAGRMDMICVLDAKGTVVFRARTPGRVGDSLATDPLAAKALAGQGSQVGSLVLSRERLLREGDDLAERARFPLLPSPESRPSDDTERNEGLVIAAAVPLRDADGKILGVLWGGNLLNRRFKVVDAIQEEVFALGADGRRAPGAVTIFLGDLRVATNVTLDDGSRAVGTRMSADVAEEVLERGATWSAPASVVGTRSITAYEPIRDPDGVIRGALYVGLPEAPFARQQGMIFLVVGTAFLAATLAGLLLIAALVLYVLRPVDRIMKMAHRVIDGDLTARVGTRLPGEIGVLCDAIDRMAAAVHDREEQLKLATRQQIGRSEKLASIGRLAAGIAHEINNPLTGVLTFAHLLREKSNMDDQDRQDLDLIIHETTRAAEIVRNLLDFARERAAIKEPLNVNEVIERTIRLIRNQKLFDRIVIREHFSNELPDVDGNMNQLQQVLLNLSLNACEAMSDGGTLTIATYPRDGRVIVEVSDTGCGIKPEHIERIFEPFFTTKPVGKGTGLGLAVSYGIIEQHGGGLEVSTEEGRGTKFTISLPAATGRVI